MTAVPVAVLALLVGLEVRVAPDKPRLGDTLSVVLSGAASGSAPSVIVGDRRYPAFPLLGGRHRAFVPLSPLETAGTRELVIDAGGDTRTLAVTVADRTFGLQHIQTRKPPTDLDPVERQRVGEAKALTTAEKRWNGRFQAPARGRISSPFGVRRFRNGLFLDDYYHRGIDYAPGAGAPVTAPAAGTVVLVGLESAGFPVHGNTVGVDHGHGVFSIFLHLSRILVKEGDRLRRGDRLGLVGGTGMVTGPHLHWGLYVNGVAIDPVPWTRGAVE